ncbi:Nn.00g007030.m01.CDS01 [Neocucurbitaria sp. VM-36]
MASRSNVYQRGGSKDAFQRSPAMGPATGLLTTLSPYNMEARRNSDVSSLSLSSFTTYSSDYSMPPTPICGRSPFSTESFEAATLDLIPTQSIHMLPLDFQMKASNFDQSLTGSWSFADSSSHMEQALPIRPNETFPHHGNYMQSQAAAYTSMETTAAAAAHPWCTAGPTYPNFDGHIDVDVLDVGPNASMHSIWHLPVQQMQEVAPPTIVPCEAMLNEEYVHVDTDPDMGTDSYDDTDVPLPPSPQHVVFKQESSPTWVKPEPESSDDERSLKRSIYETRTGGKSVKKELRLGSVSKRKMKVKKPKSRSVLWKMEDGKIESHMGAVFQGADNKWQWTDQQPRKKLYCKFPYEDDDDNIPDDHHNICGKSFLRPEHRQRHRKTHCPDKDFPCLLCDKSFNRNDNCWAHGFTHVHRPGKKDGRNVKFSLRQVISVISDPKHIEKLLNDWKKEVGSDYNPEEEEDDHPEFQEKVEKNGRMEYIFTYDADEAVRKIRCLSQ